MYTPNLNKIVLKVRPVEPLITHISYTDSLLPNTLIGKNCLSHVYLFLNEIAIGSHVEMYYGLKEMRLYKQINII